MGVDCNIYLPLDVDESGLADAIGIFAGLPKKLVEHRDYCSCDVDGVVAKGTTTSPSMGEIVLNSPPGTRLVDGEMAHFVYFHWAARFQGKLWLLVSPKSTPFWIAVGKRLVDWFGGFLVYSDCGDEKGSNLYKGKRSHPVDEDGFYPHDNEAWTEYQEAMSKQAAVSEKELASAWKKAAYKEEFDPSGKPLEKVKG